jgi:PAS domain S-box-containing protein
MKRLTALRPLIAENLLAAILYYLCAQLGLSLAIPPGIATAVWPPSGLALTVILIRGQHLLPGIFLGSFLGNFATVFTAASAGEFFMSVGILTTIALGSTLQSSLGAILIRRMVTPHWDDIFARLANIFKFAGSATVVCTVAATIGTAALMAAHTITEFQIRTTWVTWWLGDLVGMLVITPLLLTLASYLKKPFPLQFRQAAELALYFTLFLVHCQIVFGRHFPYTYSLFPFMVWGAFRFRTLGASLSGLAVAFIAIWAAVHGSSPFAISGNRPELVLLLTQAFVGTISLTGLALAAALEERGRAHMAVKRWEQIFNAAGWAVCITEEDKLTSVNAAFANMHGYQIHELIGLPITDIIAPDQRAQAAQVIAIADQNGDHVFENVHLGKDGNRFPVLVHLSSFKDTRGKVLFRASTMQDISELKEAEENLKKLAEELDHSNKELEQFAYVASHDLQEPLRVITMYLELYARRYKGQLGPEADQFIEYARLGAEDSQKLVRSLLEYAKIDAKGKSFMVTDVEKVLKQALSFLEMSVFESNAEITRRPLPKILADHFQMGRLFQNLLSNAIKYRSPDRPLKVEIFAEKRNREWVFAVKDNGIGIAAEHHDRIFGIFQRLHSRSQGSGIGLAVCKKIVERHGGKIWVESKPGEGAAFFFSIPDRPVTPSTEKNSVEPAAVLNRF